MKYIFFIILILNIGIITTSPVSVTNGGLQITTNTAYTVLCAGSSIINPVQPLSSAGSSGQALVSAGPASLPTFGILPISGGGTGAASLSSGVIQSNGSILSSLGIGSANQVLQNVAGTVSWNFTGLLQLVSTSTSARISTTGTTIPDDDTIPQFSEGTLILSLSITPKSASSTLVIFFSTSGTPTSGTTPAIAALFQNSAANALAAQYIGLRTSSSSNSGVLLYTTSSGSTAARTYQIRIGGGNFQVNSGSSSRKFGGVASTFLIIAEIA